MAPPRPCRRRLQHVPAPALLLPLALLLLLPGAARAASFSSWADFVAAFPADCPGTPDAKCTVPANVTVNITTNVTVRSLFIYGSVTVTPLGGSVTLDAAFVVARQGGYFEVSGTNWTSRVTIYLRRNEAAYGDIDYATDPMLGGGRVLAAYKGGRVRIEGLPLKRTWTLLTQDVLGGDTLICVSDNVAEWPVGSRIALAPTDSQISIPPDKITARVGAQVFTIVSGAPGGTPSCPYQIQLSGAVAIMSGQDSVMPVYQGSKPPVQGEVLLLDRTVLVTGDNFTARWKFLEVPPWGKPGDGKWSTPEAPDVWLTPYGNSTYPVEGLHTAAVGVCQADPTSEGASGYNCTSGGGWMKVKYARVEKGGQRGWIGRYPLHLHKMGDCPECELVGNAVAESQQRGITIHSTHRALVDRNVVYGVKGAGVYVEEGTELENVISNNAIVCDAWGMSYIKKNDQGQWVDAGSADSDASGGKTRGGGGCQADSTYDFGDPSRELGGCRVTGTDNEQSDCAQQAGIWALSVTNNFIGNRISNHYNGLYFQSTLFKGGRLGTDSLGRVCPLHSAFGIVSGNVIHSNGRFGTYPDVNYPNDVKRSIATNGYVQDLTQACTGDLTDLSQSAVCSCRPYDFGTGASNSQLPPAAIANGVDWGNQFVGQYDMADVQYLNFTSINNNLNMYWKGSKNFRNYTTALIKDSVFQFGTERNPDPVGCSWPMTFPQYELGQWQRVGTWGTALLSLPGASGTLIIENVVLRGAVGMAAWLQRYLYNGPSWSISPNYLKRNGGQGAALTINQQCKFFKPGYNITNPLGDLGFDEGALCTPIVHLVNVSFAGMWECTPPALNDDPEAWKPTWVNIGAANGNSYLGAVVADDDSLCGGDVTDFKGNKCPIRAVVSNYSTHLLNLPGKPCQMPVWTDWNLTLAKAEPYPDPANPPLFGRKWFRRFGGHMICTETVRRLNFWGPDQGVLVLRPPA